MSTEMSMEERKRKAARVVELCSNLPKLPIHLSKEQREALFTQVFELYEGMPKEDILKTLIYMEPDLRSFITIRALDIEDKELCEKIKSANDSLWEKIVDMARSSENPIGIFRRFCRADMEQIRACIVSSELPEKHELLNALREAQRSEMLWHRAIPYEAAKFVEQNNDRDEK